MRSITKKTYRDLARQRGQVVAVGITIALGVALFVATGGAFQNLSASYQRTYDRLHFADLVASGGDAQQAAHAALDAGAADAITRIQADPPMEINDTRLVGRVVSVPNSGRPAINDVEVVEGSYLSGPDEVLVEKHAADAFGLAPGDIIRVFGSGQWHDATVAGIVVSPEYIWAARSRQEVIADPHSFAVVFAREDTAASWLGAAPHQTLVLLPDAVTADAHGAVADAMRSAGASDVYAWQEQPSHATLKEDLDGFSQMSVAFPLLFLSAAGIASYVMLARRILKERPIIGTLMASGARKSMVLRHYLSQGLLVGLAGAVVGAGLGAALNGAITSAYTGALGIPDTVVRTYPLMLIAGLAFGAVVGLLGALMPAISAAQTAPAAAMRASQPALRPGPWSRLIARWRSLPVTGRMALRDVGRNRRRTLATALGGVLALVVVLASVGLMTSIVSALDTQFGDVDKQDATVTVSGDSVDAASLRAVDGVDSVEATTTAQVTASTSDSAYTTALVGLEPGTSMHGLLDPDGGAVDLPASGVLAGAGLRSALTVDAGDMLTIRTAEGEHQVMLVGFVREPLGTQLYATLDMAASVAPASDTRSYLVRFSEGTHRDAMRASITRLDGVVAYQDAHAVKNLVNDYMGLFWAFIGAMIALGSILALAVIYVTMAVSIAERMGELATLRAAGVSVAKVARTIAWENLVATALGIPAGLALGVWAAWAMLQTYSNDLFTLPLDMPWWLLALGALGVLLAAGLSQWPAVRAVRRVDVATVVRERAA